MSWHRTTTINCSMKEISNAGVGIPNFDDVSSSIELSIPSKNVVNPVSASIAPAMEHD